MGTASALEKPDSCVPARANWRYRDEEMGQVEMRKGSGKGREDKTLGGDTVQGIIVADRKDDGLGSGDGPRIAVFTAPPPGVALSLFDFPSLFSLPRLPLSSEKDLFLV